MKITVPTLWLVGPGLALVLAGYFWACWAVWTRFIEPALSRITWKALTRNSDLAGTEPPTKEELHDLLEETNK